MFREAGVLKCFTFTEAKTRIISDFSETRQQEENGGKYLKY